MKYFLILVLTLFFFSCKSSKEENYSFFIAGHTYGSQIDKENSIGLYRPFKDKFDFINSEKNIELGFLLGDVVYSSKRFGSWEAAKKDMNILRPKIYVARGNHDGALEQFENQFGKSYKSFVHKKNLFLIIDPNLDEWNISGEQLLFFKNAIKKEEKNVNNIFILTHQMIWWDKRLYPKPFPNSIDYKSTDSNYWTTIEPILKKTNKPVYLFAGDVGAFSKEHRKKDHIIEYDYHKDVNITYVSSGMGGGVRDNFIIVNVSKEGEVSFRLIHLNGNDINGLGKLEDYGKSN